MKLKRLATLAACCVLVGMLGFVLLILGYGLFERISGKRHLESLRQELTANGTLLPLAELAPPPSSEAIANGKKFLAAIEKFKEFGEKPAAYYGPVMPRFLSPGIAEPVAAQAAPLFEGVGQEPMPKTWDELAQQLAPVSSILDSAKDLLKVPMALPFDYGKPIPLGESQHLVAWLRADAALRLHGSDVSGAIDDVVAIQRIAKLVGSVHTVIAKALETGLWVYGSSGLCWEILQTAPLTGSDLERLSQSASSGNFVAEAVHGLQTEATMLPGAYQSNENYITTKGSDFADHPEGVWGTWPALAARNFLWRFIWIDGDQAAALSTWGRVLPETRKLLVDKNWSAFSKEHPREEGIPSNYDLWRYPFADLLSGRIFQGLFKATVRAETNRQLILAAIALERYRLKNAHYPERLEQLVPDYLSVLPCDWFNGQSLKYRTLPDNKYRLYAVGQDDVDQGGDATLAENSERLGINTGRDIVWPQAKAP